MLGVTSASAAERAGLEELMAGYQRADAEAAAELVRQLSPVLFRFFASDLATRAFAEDLLQECWLRIHKSRHTYLPGEPLLPWVFAIARHTRVDAFPRRRRIESHELAIEGCAHCAAPPDAESGELSRLLERLPDTQREVILMLEVAGMTLEEVAGSTSSTVGSVKQKAHRAYRKRRQILEQSASERVRP